MKKILFVASECVPFIKTGGLADVCGALPKEFDKNYWDVRVVIPDYSCIPEQYRNNFEYVTHFYMSSGPYVQDKYVGVLKYEQDGVTYYFIDNQEFFTGFSPYTSDTKFEIEKYTFFDKAVLSMLPLIDFKPDIIHCHDWQTGFLPVYLKNEFAANPFFWVSRLSSLSTILSSRVSGTRSGYRVFQVLQTICSHLISLSSRRMQICLRVVLYMLTTSPLSVIHMQTRFRQSTMVRD